MYFGLPDIDGMKNAIQSESERAKKEYQDRVKAVQDGGYLQTPDMLRRDEAWNQGLVKGNQFYNDPTLQRVRDMYEAQSKGYDSAELAGMRSIAREQIAGSQAASQRALASNLGRGGVGGARGAAILNTAAETGNKNVAAAETKMALDSAGMKRQGTRDLASVLEKHTMGKYGTAAANAGMVSSDYAASEQAKAASANRGKW